MGNNKSDHQAIMDHLIDLKEGQGAINQHLKDLNGRVADNVNRLNFMDSMIDKVNAKIAYYVGAIAVIIFGLQLYFGFKFS